MEEGRQVSSKERPSIATSQVWINAEHGEERARASAMAATPAAAPVGVARAKVVGSRGEEKEEKKMGFFE